MTKEQQYFIEGIEAAAKHLLEMFPNDNKPDGAAAYALQIQLLANREKAKFRNNAAVEALGSGKI
jgi:hypothetical protein